MAHVIRRARPDDAPAIQACARQAYARYVPRIGRPPAPMGADYAALIAAGDVSVATGADGGFLGFIVYRAAGRDLLLENVAVLPGAAGRGIGKALIAHCEQAARAQGAAAVRLYTNAKMTENLALYPRLGYAETARRSEDGFERVYFEKRLA